MNSPAKSALRAPPRDFAETVPDYPRAEADTPPPARNGEIRRAVVLREMDNADAAKAAKPEFYSTPASMGRSTRQRIDDWANGVKKRENILKNPKVKGFLTGTFASAAVMGTAKLAFNTAIRTFDATGIGVALGTGGWNTGREIISDYKKARAIIIEDVQTGRLDAFRSIWTKDNSKKYAWKFAKGSAVGLVGVGVADLWLEHGGSFTDTLKEWTKRVRDFTAPVTNWISNFFKPMTEWFSNIKNAIADKFSGWSKGASVPAKTSNVVKGPITHAAPASQSLPTISSPTATPVTPTIAPTVEAATVAPSLPINETVITEVLSPRAQLEQLASSGDITPRAAKTIKAALAGKGWAMNEAIDGMLNHRFGFAENTELAVKLTKELAASGNVEGQIKLAYMQYNGAFAEAGVAPDRKAALETITKIGRSWVGGEALLNKGVIATPEMTLANVAPLPAAVVPAPAVPAPVITEAMNCTAKQNLPGISPQFQTSCTPNVADFKPGNTIGLNIDFNNGAHSSHTMTIGQKAAVLPKAQYLEQVLSSALSQIEAPTAPALTASLR